VDHRVHVASAWVPVVGVLGNREHGVFDPVVTLVNVADCRHLAGKHHPVYHRGAACRSRQHKFECQDRILKLTFVFKAGQWEVHVFNAGTWEQHGWREWRRCCRVRRTWCWWESVGPPTMLVEHGLGAIIVDPHIEHPCVRVHRGFGLRNCRSHIPFRRLASPQNCLTSWNFVRERETNVVKKIQ
jgi:hypothetical protein